VPPPVRDNGLLDALDTLERVPWSGAVWRSVRRGRDPLECARAGGRWDDRTFDVLYTSETRDGAVAERRFHLFRGQPIPPSKILYDLFELRVELAAVVSFADLDALRAVGMITDGYGRAAYAEREGEYPRSQEIAEACFFLGADGIRVPNARHDSDNLIVFCDQEPPPGVAILRNHGALDWRNGTGDG
jgi:RES domain-containing protein